VRFERLRQPRARIPLEGERARGRAEPRAQGGVVQQAAARYSNSTRDMPSDSSGT
jgi:hypothetical protein